MTEGTTGEVTPIGGDDHRVRYERRGNEPPSVTVATALARHHGEEVTETSTQLYEYIDPDALDTLFADTYEGVTRTPGSVEFEVDDVTVEIRPSFVELSTG